MLFHASEHNKLFFERFSLLSKDLSHVCQVWCALTVLVRTPTSYQLCMESIVLHDLCCCKTMDDANLRYGSIPKHWYTIDSIMRKDFFRKAVIIITVCLNHKLRF